MNSRRSAFIGSLKKLVFCSLFSLCSLVAIPVLSAPRIECEHPKYDFGTVVGQEKITHDFIIWNRGDEPLEIVKIKNCCGVETKVDPIIILPGSNAVCTSVFTTKNRYGTQNKQILLITNDKKNSYYDLRMTGTLQRPVEFAPRFVRLGDLLPDSKVSETITVTNLLNRIITLDSLSSTVAGLEAEVVKESVDRKSEQRRHWTVRLKSTGVLSVGQLSGQIKLGFSTGTMTVPFSGTVNPIIQATPATIRFSSSATMNIERVVMLRSGDDRGFEVLSAKLKDANGKVEIKKLADGKWQLKLMIQPSAIKPTAALVIKTSVESQDTITIPLVGS